jgi:hypothetical protein
VPAQTIFQANNGRGLPKRTFNDTMSLFSGPDKIDLYYFGRGHTNGDAWVVFPALRTVHAGDIFSGKNIPLLDANNGGSAMLIADTPDLSEYIAFNREFLNDMRAAKKAGKSVDDAAASWKIPAKYAGYAAPDANRLKNNVRLAYAEIDKGVTR